MEGRIMDQQAARTTDRPIDVLLEQYSESHRNHANEVIHCVCVPLIVFSLLGLLWALHPLVAVAAAIAAQYYYFKLSPGLARGMVAMSCVMLLVLRLLPPPAVMPLSVFIFVVAWVGQFIGHKIEGKKPSFLDDVRFLLIGPLFVLRFLYRRYNLAY
jgi:uncharacterized membrane protein YGL010W